MLGAGVDPGDRFWLHADPVHLHAQRTELVLVDASRLDIDPAESAELLEALNAHFAQDDLLLRPLSPAQWVMRTPTPARLRTVSLDAAVGCNVDPLLPQGADALRWHRLTNEAQMLLHTHPANVRRESRAAPTVNSLWLWGVGALPQCRTALTATWGGDPFVRGMARCAGISQHATPEAAPDWMSTAMPGHHMVILDPPPEGAPDPFRAVSDNWAGPVLDAVANGRLGSATLAAFAYGQCATWTVTRSDLWKFWRREPRFPDPSVQANA